MWLALLPLLVCGQTIYEWTDAKGEQHFTDDRSTIPKGAKARTTEGAELGVMKVEGGDAGGGDAGRPAIAPKGGDAGGGDAGRPGSAPKGGTVTVATDTCAVAAAQLRASEERLRAERARADATRSAQAETACLAVLNRLGKGEYARCMAKNGQPLVTPEQEAAQLEPFERAVQTAREALRRAQVTGCR